MPQYSKKKKQQTIDILPAILRAIGICAFVGFVWWAFWIYFNVYKPEERRYERNSRYVYMLLQDELTQFYKTHGYIYKQNKSGTIDSEDEFCELLVKKYSLNGGICHTNDKTGYSETFTFKNRGIVLYGMERAPFKFEGTLVKEFFIDVDGSKGENTMGIDRLPLRIYSTGRLGGLVTPVNCKISDYNDYGIPYAKICQSGVDIDFLDTNFPIGFDIIQVGGKSGKSKVLNRNVSLLRADCLGYGAELIGADDYCEMKKMYWMKSCYHEFPCAVEITGKFKK